MPIVALYLFYTSTTVRKISEIVGMLKGKVNKQTNKQKADQTHLQGEKKKQLLQCKSRMSSKMPVSVFSCQWLRADFMALEDSTHNTN